jgi:hypothetical protein
MHEIQALVAAPEDTACLVASVPGTPTVDTGLTWRLIPLTADFVTSLTGTGLLLPDLEDREEAEGFAIAVERIVRRLAAAPLRAAVAGVFTQYSGGYGMQAAFAVRAGEVIMQPVAYQGAINEALRLIGVRAGSADDEFAAIGLHRWRSMDSLAAGHCS